MPKVAAVPFLVPRSTSQLVCAPLYERPLLQAKYNTSGDRATWVRELSEWPADLPPSARYLEVSPESEMSRLAATYGVEAFRKVYPIDELFRKAFAACEVLPSLDAQPVEIPNLEKTSEHLVAEFLELNVPAMTKEKAEALVKANYTADTVSAADAKAVSAATGLPLNFARSVIEAAKLRVQRERVTDGAPSAPSRFQPKVEAPGLV